MRMLFLRLRNAATLALVLSSSLHGHCQSQPASSPQTGATAPSKTTAIRAGTRSIQRRDHSKNQVVLVKDGKITAKGEDVSIPKDAHVVDLSKECVMPGSLTRTRM